MGLLAPGWHRWVPHWRKPLEVPLSLWPSWDQEDQASGLLAERPKDVGFVADMEHPALVSI